MKRFYALDEAGQKSCGGVVDRSFIGTTFAVGYSQGFEKNKKAVRRRSALALLLMRENRMVFIPRWEALPALLRQLPPWLLFQRPPRQQLLLRPRVLHTPRRHRPGEAEGEKTMWGGWATI